MRTLLSISVLVLAILVAGEAIAQMGTLTFRADVSGQGTWTGPPKRITPNADFYVDIYANNIGGTSPRITWSSSFTFTLTGSTHKVIWGDSSLFAQAQFKSFWDVYCRTYAESWDGNLPDLFNFTGIASGAAGYPGNLGEILVLKIALRLGCPGNNSGQFCVEQGDAINDVYDWIFDDPQPTFPKTCWQIEVPPCGYAPQMDNCDPIIPARILQPASFQFHATPFFPDDPIKYDVVSGPGTIDSITGIWSYTPPFSDAWKALSLVVRAKDPSYYCHGCGDGREYCSTLVMVQGVCGDCDISGIVNISDITRMINCLYYYPSKCPLGMSSACDANGNGMKSIQDVTYLINYLYKGGPPPLCGPWSER
ncbi:MAG: hypothetical protein NT002_10450 [candidate division Zixibacteria bacterium]|nr:hypothetical protein [candidate division Zixibacteria bacterium]